MIWLNNYLKETAVSSAAQTRSSGASYPGIEQRVQVAVVLPSLNLMRLTNYRGIRRALTGKVCCGFFPPLKTKCPISSQMHLTDLNALKKKKRPTAAGMFLIHLFPVFYSITFFCTSLGSMVRSQLKCYYTERDTHQK